MVTWSRDDGEGRASGADDRAGDIVVCASPDNLLVCPRPAFPVGSLCARSTHMPPLPERRRPRRSCAAAGLLFQSGLGMLSACSTIHNELLSLWSPCEYDECGVVVCVRVCVSVSVSRSHPRAAKCTFSLWNAVEDLRARAFSGARARSRGNVDRPTSQYRSIV